MTTLTTGALATQVLEITLLAVEDLTRRLTLLALDAVQQPEHSTRKRALLLELDDAVVRCEGDQAIYVPLLLEP